MEVDWKYTEDGDYPDQHYPKGVGLGSWSDFVFVCYDTGGFAITRYNHQEKMWESEIQEKKCFGTCDSWVVSWSELPDLPDRHWINHYKK